MRNWKDTAETIEVQYPDELCFAFNRNEVVMTSDYERVVFEFSSGTVKFSDQRDSFNKKVSIDISLYLQLFFDVKESELIGSKKITVAIKDVDGNFILRFYLNCVWGVMNIGEVYNDSYKLTWFKNYPQTFSLFVTDTYAMRQEDSSRATSYILNSGLQHLALSDVFPTAKKTAQLSIGSSVTAVFDYTYDTTFTSATAKTIDVEVNDDDCGVFLRWIDRHGFYRYWLFKEGAMTYKATDKGVETDIPTSKLSESLTLYYGMTRKQGKELTVQKSICASLVDEDTFTMLTTLLSSPMPSLWTGSEWIPIAVVAGSSTRASDVLQDFEVQIILPSIITQSL